MIAINTIIIDTAVTLPISGKEQYFFVQKTGKT